MLATATLAMFLILSTGLGISLVLLDQVNRERLEKTEALGLAEKESLAKERALDQIRASESALKAQSDQLKAESKAKQQALVAMEESQQALQEESQAKEAALVNLQKALSEVKAQSQRASRLYLTGRASSVLRSSPAQALLLALEATAYEPGELTNGVLLKALRSDRELNVLRGHEPLINAKFSFNGKIAVSVSPARGVRLWDSTTGRCIQIMDAPGVRRLVDAVLSPDASRLVMAYDNGRAYLWDVRSGKMIATLEGHAKGVQLTSACFSPDGSLVLTTSRDGTARMWNAHDGAAKGEPLSGHECGVASAVFSPDGKTVMTASDGRLYEFEFDERTGERVSASITYKNGNTTIRFFDVESGQHLRTIGELEGKVSVASFSSDGSLILTHCRNGVHLHNVETGELVWKPARELRWNPAGGCVFGRDDDTIIKSDPVSGVAVWDIKTRKQLQLFSGASGAESVVLSPDRKLIAARISGDEESIGIWQVGNGKQLATMVGHEDRVTSMAFHPDSKSLITGSADGTARIWNAAIEKEFGDLVASNRLVGTQKMILSEDGQRLVLVKSRRTEIIDCVEGRKISEILRRPSPQGSPLSLTNLVQRRPIRMAFYSGDGKRIISFFDNGRFSLWMLSKASSYGIQARLATF